MTKKNSKRDLQNYQVVWLCTKAAVDEGIVIGGGAALIKASQADFESCVCTS